MTLASILGLLLMVLGFGFVVFWHELGHFLAAKWAGVRVEQFAVGFGHAIACWRKGIGFTVGTSAKEYERRAIAHLAKTGQQTTGFQEGTGYTQVQIDQAARELGMSETEYRINWIPLGGYVKMLGQDDADPTSLSTDPRSYTEKPVGKRMVIISAGVIMNVILAGILFVVLFLYGFRVPPAVVGLVVPGSPAQAAGLQVGDRIVSLNGHDISDFTKVSFNAALLPDRPVEIVVERDGKVVPLEIHARRAIESEGMMALGVGPMYRVTTPPPDDFDMAEYEKLPERQRVMRPGDTIVRAGEVALASDDDVAGLSRALQASAGKPVPITLRSLDGSTREAQMSVRFANPFNGEQLHFAGMTPRVVLGEPTPGNNSVDGKLKAGDIVVSVRNVALGTLQSSVGPKQFMETVYAAGKKGHALDISVLRDGEFVEVKGLVPGTYVARSVIGLGIPLSAEMDRAAVGAVLDNTPASVAGIAPGSIIQRIGDRDVTTWADVREALVAQAKPGEPITIVVVPPDATLTPAVPAARAAESDASSASSAVTRSLSLPEADFKRLAGLQYVPGDDVARMFSEKRIVRQTRNPFEAMAWGVGETRDLILKSYVTLQRMFVDRTVSPSNLMGPIEIFRSGSLFAQRGPDWFIWFLAMISANLAVVNFLPIPIVDGGHFAFLVIEKLTGKKPSPAVQTISAYVGLALLLSLFVFVTYNDLGRIFKVW